MKKNISILILSLVCFISSAQNIENSKAFQLVKKYKNVLEITMSEQEQPTISSAYTDAAKGISYIYVQQNYKNVAIENIIKTVAIQNNQLQYWSGNFYTNLASKVVTTLPTISTPVAINNALAHLNLLPTNDLVIVKDELLSKNYIEYSKTNQLKHNIKVTLLLTSKNDGNTLDLVWDVLLSPKETQDNWHIKIDATTGAFLSKKNATIFDNFGSNTQKINPKSIQALVCKNNNFATPPPPPSATNIQYKVIRYPFESPFYASPTVETNPWLLAGIGNNAITNGWHFDGTNNYNYTRGNNVYAYDDSANIDQPGRSTISSTTFPNLNFTTTPNFNQQPFSNSNRDFAITNLFYWNNVVHDITYQYGFDEVAGNFQNNNFGRGGIGGDYVFAEAQDGGGTDNANFNPQKDGDTCTMQMYLWSSSGSFTVNAPVLIAGNYAAVEGSVSTNNLMANVGAVSGQIVAFEDNATLPITNTACGSASNNLSGKIALIIRGGCSFAIKIKAAQNAGAIGVIVYNTSNAVGPMSGNDNSITIPAVMVSLSTGNLLLNQLAGGEVVTGTLNAGVMFDGDLDNGIVVHEYTHGISNRLTGGPNTSSCLENNEQAGEGWSDYYALMLTQNWQTTGINDGILPRKMGVYAADQDINGNGIRRYPYTTDIVVNPLTYNNLKTNGGVHAIGEVWCVALWDMTWNIIAQDGVISPNLYNANAAGGNVVAMQLVTTGMKLQPCSPGFLDSRDAILAADSILYNKKYRCTIWAAFAKRGMGFSAKQGSSGSTTDQTAAFDLPTGIKLSAIDNFKIASINYPFNLKVSATCNCKSPTNNYIIKATLPSNLTYSSVTGGSKVGNVVTFAPINFAKPNAKDSSTKLTVTVSAGGCNIDTVINDNRDNKTLGGFVSNSVVGGINFKPISHIRNSGNFAWRVIDSAVVSNTDLTSAVFNTSKFSLFSFYHFTEFENIFDGGVVEKSTNLGTTWTNLGSKAIVNGYNAQMDATSGLGNIKAFSGVTNGRFKQSIFDISTATATNQNIRFRMQTDAANGDVDTLAGWVLDDITATNGCGGYITFAIYDSANIFKDSLRVPIYATPVVLPVTFVAIHAQKNGNKVAVSWEVANEINIIKYDVETSIDGITWVAFASKEITTLSSKTNNYLVHQTNAFDGVNFYRIKAFDANGSVQYSSIIKLIIATNNSEPFTIIPNPASSLIKIIVPNSFNANQYKIFNSLGSTAIAGKVNTANNMAIINIETLPNGLYELVLYNKLLQSIHQKLVVSK
jgi:extracellular elastinolytic metalloproteinase